MSDRQQERIWPITLQQIEETVASHLGKGRVPGNKQDECFSRQVSMYLAKNVGGWSTPQIGRFYNGRHHTTVLYAIEKIERLRKQDASVDALLEVLSGDLRSAATCSSPSRPLDWSNTFLDVLAERILRRLASSETSL
jgi:chromosomal replication initiation ATPase DnaA